MNGSTMSMDSTRLTQSSTINSSVINPDGTLILPKFNAKKKVNRRTTLREEDENEEDGDDEEDDEG